MMKYVKILFPLCLLGVPVTSLSETAESAVKSDVKKSAVSFKYNTKNSSLKDSRDFSVTASIQLHDQGYDPFGSNSKYKFSVNVSAGLSEAETSTEETEKVTRGIGFEFGETESSRRLKPYVSLGLEDIKESKSNATEEVDGEFDSSYKWGLGFTFPLKDQKSSGMKHDPILGLDVSTYWNFDGFPFEDKVYRETKISVVFNMLAWWNNRKIDSESN